MFVEDLVGCFADARAGFDVLGSRAKGVEDGGEVVDRPVGLVGVEGCDVCVCRVWGSGRVWL